MKTCFKCSRSQPIEEFYRHSAMADGHLGKCKSCTRIDTIKNRNDKIEYYRKYDRTRGKTAERKLAIRVKNDRKARKMGPEFVRAHNDIQRAVKSGLIIKPAHCERCPRTDHLNAHHDDYSRPLDVMWLCPVCHAARHKELGRLRTVAKIYDQTANAY